MLSLAITKADLVKKLERRRGQIVERRLTVATSRRRLFAMDENLVVLT